jgi:hypothetical protein
MMKFRLRDMIDQQTSRYQRLAASVGNRSSLFLVPPMVIFQKLVCHGFNRKRQGKGTDDENSDFHSHRQYQTSKIRTSGFC